MLIPASPPARIVILSPMDSVVSPAAWTIPIHSWSTTSNSSPVSVITTNDPNTLLARPRAARVRAVGVATDEAGDQLEAEEQQHHKYSDAEQQVVDRQVAGTGDVNQGGGVEDVPHGLEQPARRSTHGLGEPVERGRHQRRGGFTSGFADSRDDGQITYTHRYHSSRTWVGR